MGKIGKSAKPELFEALYEMSRKMKETNDCSVVAIAVLCGVTYQEAHAAMKAQGRKDRQGAYDFQIIRAARSFGKSIQRVEVQSIIDQFPGNHKTLKSMTTYHPIRFRKVFESMVGSYMVFTSCHVCSLVDGKIIDWSNDKALRVTSMFEVL
jgi:hypothetical protein